MKKTFKNKNNLIIGLCAILLIMAVGFASFSQKLSISDTSSSDSNWNVYISDVNVNSKSEKAAGSGQITSRESASFTTNLSSPGDYVIYNITVKNDGNIDAILEEIKLNKNNNLSVILYEINGIEENDTLLAGDEKTFTLKVSYDSSQTGTLSDNQKTNSLTLTLNFAQKGSSNGGSSSKTVLIGGQSVNVISTGDGLYESEYEEGRYIYRGASPDNYLTLGEDEYRIISRETDGTLKVIKSESVGKISFDPGYSTYIDGITDKDSTDGTRYSSDSNDYCYTSSASEYYGCKVWGNRTTMLDSNGSNVTTMPWKIGGTELNLPDREAYINTYLNTTWYNSLSSDVQNVITTHLFNVGLATDTEKNLATTLSTEKAYKWSGKVGLLNVSDYALTTANENCNSGIYSHYYTTTCSNANSVDNWLYKDIMKNANNPLLMTPYSYNSFYPHCVWSPSSGGQLGFISVNAHTEIIPVFYLTSDIELSGSGKANAPFILSAQ